MSKRYKLLILAGVVICLLACNNKSKNHHNQQKKATLSSHVLTFDDVLKCHPYSYNDGCFITADYGCIYKPDGGNDIGNIVVCLISKKPLVVADDQIPFENKKINALTAAQYKKDYNIYIFLIDKKYLNYNKDGDPVYYQNNKFTEALYTYNSDSDKWNMVDSINVNGDPAKEQSWRNKRLDQVIIKPKPQVATHSNPGSISDKWAGTYTVSEDNSDWKDVQKISLSITKDSIIFHAEGYQIDQTYLLSGTESGAGLQLKYKSAKNDTESEVLKRVKDFGLMIYDKGIYKWTCPYIDISFKNGKSRSYRVTRY